MRKSKVRALLIASVMIALCTAMIVGGTYALWSDSVTVSNHLSAGTLKVGLKRTYLEKYTLGANMYMQTTTDDTETSTTANIFGMAEDERIVPTSSYAARLKLINMGDVAIDYTINIVAKNTSDEDLAKQVKVAIGYGEVGGVTYGEWKYLATNDGESVNFTQFTVGGGTLDGTQTEKEFWVKIVFEDRTDNNAAKDQEASFDVLIEATQKTTPAVITD